jgi:hypothetical protein
MHSFSTSFRNFVGALESLQVRLLFLLQVLAGSFYHATISRMSWLHGWLLSQLHSQLLRGALSLARPASRSQLHGQLHALLFFGSPAGSCRRRFSHTCQPESSLPDCISEWKKAL